MEKIGRFGVAAIPSLVLCALLLSAGSSQADPGNNYCVTPAFVSGNIPPNLLLMIDNSASMYDLAFVDQGKKHCSSSGANCVVDSDCTTAGETCSVFDRRPYYCYDQTYVNATTYAGYFANKTAAGTADQYYSYDFTNNGFVPSANAFPDGCGTHSGTITKRDNNNAVCVEYNNDSSKTVVSFVAKGNYLNWLTASKFDVEKRILTGGKYVTKVCTKNTDVACASDGDCTGGTGPCIASTGFVQPESRGCVGQGYIKDALTTDFVNYNAPATNNTNTQLAVTFSVHGPVNPFNITAPSAGGQTFIDLFATTSSKKYDYSACQTAVATLANTSSSNAQVKQDVAACLSGSAQGTCSDPPTGTTVNCFSTYPDCYVPGRCSGDTTKTCLTSTDCASGQSCTFGYFCEGPNGVLTNLVCTTPGANSPDCPATQYLCDEKNPSPYTSGPKNLTTTCSSANVGQQTGCYTPPTYWCDWGAEWMSSAAAPTGYTCNGPTDTAKCTVSNTDNGKCSKKLQTSCQTDADCQKNADNGVCLGYKSQGTHACVVHVPAVDHGICRSIAGTTNGVCGGQKDYGVCNFGATDTPTKTKVNFQQTMQACWAYNRFITPGATGGTDIGIDDYKTMDKQCTDIYNSGYKVCSNDSTRTCTDNASCTVGTTTGTCLEGPAAILPGSPALICGTDWEGSLYYKSGSTWVRKGSINDKTTPLSDILVNGSPMTYPNDLCVATDTYPGCMKKIYQAFCPANKPPGVPDPTDAPSDSATYDNLPAILSGIGVQSQLGSPIASLRARIVPGSCTTDADCPNGNSVIGNRCSGGICKPTGLIQEFSTQIRLGAMTFNTYGSATETASGYTASPAGTTQGIKASKVCSNDTTKACTADIDCGTTSGVTCQATAAGTTNLDGGRVIYEIGKGKCTTLTTTPCANDTTCGSGAVCYNGYCGNKGSTVCTNALTCSSGQVCVRDSAGDHSTDASLIQKIDGIKAAAWTPFAETFYNALGYFAAIPQSNGSFKSRVDGASSDANITGLRLYGAATGRLPDFDENLNPSEYRCQQNHILLVTDGSSTADRNPKVSAITTTPATDAGAGLGPRYAAASGTSSIYCPAVNGVDYGGTSNLPILSWLGRRQNLATFRTDVVTPVHCSLTTTTTCRLDSDCPSGETCGNGTSPRDFVSTWVVFNGADNGAGGACDAFTLLDKTATNGGTTLKQAKKPDELVTALTSIFQNIAAKASSGTAASILSNSEGSGANILQAVFYPKKVYDNQTSANWVGEMQNLWYFVDPMINHSTIREDTDGDRTLNLINDKVVSLRFDPTDNTTYAYVSTDTNGDGVGDTTEVKEDADLVKSVWRAGKQLWARDLTLSPRVIYTPKLSGGTEVGTSGLMNFSYGTIGSTVFADNSTVLKPYLQMPDVAGTVKLMKYVHGFDFPGDPDMRSRTVQIGSIPGATVGSGTYISNPRDKGIGVWKLGDIISSTPRIQSNGRLNGYGVASPGGYSDASYNSFLGSNEYKSRGMVYVGANDGMLHAFKLGLLDVTASGFSKASLSGTGLGEEQWAFIPKQALPYLKYNSDPAYNHIYYVDGSTVVVDASIGDYASGSCTSANYYDCPKNSVVVDSSNALDSSKNTWMTVLIGGMGLGGASAKSCTSGTNCVATPLADPGDSTGTKGLGYSSYYALNVTDPNNPKLLWEFSDPALGYATTGPAVVRVGEATKNGRWFAVFGSGPTGPIDVDNHQFMGRSDQNLKFFVVDMRTGQLVTTIDTGITNAFAGSMVGGAIDADRWNPNVTGNYQDDAIYVGYTRKSSSTDAWTDGGVVRIVTNESITPDSTTATLKWSWSKVIEGVGPVTSAISRLQDRKNKRLWLYFGTGRYFSRAGSTIDDYSTQRAIYGIKDPCYNYSGNPGNLLDKTCMRTQSSVSAVDPASLTDQSSGTLTAAKDISAGGWKVTLDPSTTTYGAERVVTDAVALTNGTVFLTSFEPTSDPCGFGGNSFLWALDYSSGGRPPDAALAGKALIQLSTGEFKEVDLSQAFGSGASRLMRRTSTPMTGKPPADAFPVISKSSNKPVKRIMHIQER